MDAPTHRVAAAVLVRGRRVLLCHRHPDRRWYPNLWDIPGGHIEPDEQPAEALARELGEELGITVDPHAIGTAYDVLRHLPDLELNVWFIYEWTGEVTNRAPEEHDEFGWFRSSQLDELRLADPKLVDLCRAALDGPGALREMGGINR